MTTDHRIQLLLDVLDQAYDKKAWHGTNLRGSIRGLSLEEVTWLPQAGRHTIWSVVLHAAYWKFCVRRHLAGDRSLKFPRQGSDWPKLPEQRSEKTWKLDVQLLGSEHRALREALTAFSPRRLVSKPPNLSWRFDQYIYGAASHDLYHAGQIQLLKRLFRTRQAN
jgi:hypothetical protein